MQVAVLGTGTMGAGFAHRLLAKGFDVRVWNRTRAKAEPLGAEGATVADTPLEAVRGADVVITMLFDAEAVAEVMTEAVDGVGPHAVWLQMSTVGVAGTRRLAELAHEHGLRMLDAPVLGTKKPAYEGTIVVLASGDPALREPASPVFDALAARTMWVGDELGSGSALKLTCNGWIGTVTAGVAQAIALAEGLGLQGEQFLKAITGGQMDTPYAHVKGAEMLADDYPTSFALDGLLKDLRMATDAGTAAGVDTATLAAVRDLFARASAGGRGREDIAAVYTALA